MFKGFYRPYFTIFDEKFSELKGEKFIKNGLLLGVTNPLFNKTLNNICYALRLDREHLQFQRAKFGNAIPPKKLLISFKNKPRMKSSVVVSNVLSNNGSPTWPSRTVSSFHYKIALHNKYMCTYRVLQVLT